MCIEANIFKFQKYIIIQFLLYHITLYSKTGLNVLQTSDNIEGQLRPDSKQAAVPKVSKKLIGRI